MKNHGIEILICNFYCIIDWVNSQTKQGSQHQFVTNRQQLELAVKKRVDKVLGIFSKSHLSYDYKRPEYQPSLSEMTESAIDLLESSRYERPKYQFPLVIFKAPFIEIDRSFIP